MRGTPAIYFKSLNRYFNIIGIDRQIFFLLLGLSAPVAISAIFSPKMDIIAVIVFLIGYIAGVLITRADNQMVEIFRRHIRYRKYYSPNSGIHAPLRTVKQSVPIYVGKRGLV